MAQLFVLKDKRKGCDSKKERSHMIRDSRQKINTSKFTLKEKRQSNKKLVSGNSNKKQKGKAITQETFRAQKFNKELLENPPQ